LAVYRKYLKAADSIICHAQFGSISPANLVFSEWLSHLRRPFGVWVGGQPAGFCRRGTPRVVLTWFDGRIVSLRIGSS
jgi:hypothetical protein